MRRRRRRTGARRRTGGGPSMRAARVEIRGERSGRMTSNPTPRSSGPGGSGPGGAGGGGHDESPAAWTLRRAEELIASLSGVLSARIVADRSGGIEEVHVLTTPEIAPKQAV